MTNPNNAIGTNAAYNGRTSVNAFNDNLAAYNIGILSGWYCDYGEEGTGFSVYLGGDGTYRDVAIASSPNSGDKVTINNISGQPVPITLPQPPVTDWRIDTIVAYVDNPPQGDETTVDNPAACGIIVVKGQLEDTATDAEIEAAITADGASGATAYWVPLAGIFVPAGAEDITDCEILDQVYATINTDYIIPEKSIYGYMIADETVTSTKLYLTAQTSSTDSITLNPGKWLVSHRLSAGQISLSSKMVLYYSINEFPGFTTLAGKSDVQQLWENGSETAIVTLSAITQLKRTDSVNDNVEIRDEYWTAVKIG